MQLFLDIYNIYIYRERERERAKEIFFSLKLVKTDFDKKIPNKFGLKEPYLDVILNLGNQAPPPIKTPK